MGFFDDVGETLFGTASKGRADAAVQESLASQRAASQAAQGIQKEQGALAGQYGKGLQQSMGANAADYMNLANQAAQGQAAQSAQAGTTQAIRNALQASRSSGLNKGQSALAGAQQAGNAYTGLYQGGLESGRNQYQNAANTFGAQTNQATANQMNALNTQANIAAGQGTNAQNQAANAQGAFNSTMGAIGKGIGAVGQLLSDKNAKEDIKGSSSLDEIMKKIKPVDFKYKEGTGMDGEDRTGVLAQDLEKTPLAAAVMDTPQGKQINTDELSPAVLNLVLQLAQKVKDLEGRK